MNTDANDLEIDITCMCRIVFGYTEWNVGYSNIDYPDVELLIPNRPHTVMWNSSTRDIRTITAGITGTGTIIINVAGSFVVGQLVQIIDVPSNIDLDNTHRVIND